MSSGSSPGNTNYTVIAKNKKPKKLIDVEKIKEIREAIIQILSTDKLFWDKKGKAQPGIERNNLIRKVSSLEKSNTSIVFDFLLKELENEQKIVPLIQDGQMRYILLDLGNNNGS